MEGVPSTAMICDATWGPKENTPLGVRAAVPDTAAPAWVKLAMMRDSQAGAMVSRVKKKPMESTLRVTEAKNSGRSFFLRRYWTPAQLNSRAARPANK